MKILVSALLILLLFITGCATLTESSQSTGPTSQHSLENTIHSQQETACPPSIGNCNMMRGAANQIEIQCNDGRQYTRGSAGQISIQYPGKQITVGAAGQESFQGFEQDEARCLIEWLKKF